MKYPRVAEPDYDLCESGDCGHGPFRHWLPAHETKATGKVVPVDALVVERDENGEWSPVVLDPETDHPSELGWCATHEGPALRYSDGEWGCWWEQVVEFRADDYEHGPGAFVPIFDALEAAQGEQTDE